MIFNNVAKTARYFDKLCSAILCAVFFLAGGFLVDSIIVNPSFECLFPKEKWQFIIFYKESGW